jgi:hypothetical protein
LKNFTAADSAYWTFEYDFKKSFEQSSVSPASLNNVSELIFADSTFRKKYIKFYMSDNEQTYPDDYSNWFYNWCGFGNMTIEEYAECMCRDSLNYK